MCSPEQPSSCWLKQYLKKNNHFSSKYQHYPQTVDIVRINKSKLITNCKPLHYCADNLDVHLPLFIRDVLDIYYFVT